MYVYFGLKFYSKKNDFDKSSMMNVKTKKKTIVLRRFVKQTNDA